MSQRSKEINTQSERCNTQSHNEVDGTSSGIKSSTFQVDTRKVLRTISLRPKQVFFYSDVPSSHLNLVSHAKATSKTSFPRSNRALGTGLRLHTIHRCSSSQKGSPRKRSTRLQHQGGGDDGSGSSHRSTDLEGSTGEGRRGCDGADGSDAGGTDDGRGRGGSESGGEGSGDRAGSDGGGGGGGDDGDLSGGGGNGGSLSADGKVSLLWMDIG